MHTEEHTAMLLEIATLLDVELEEVKKFVELMIDGYNFEDGVNGCALTSGECKLILEEIQTIPDTNIGLTIEGYRIETVLIKDNVIKLAKLEKIENNNEPDEEQEW